MEIKLDISATVKDAERFQEYVNAKTEKAKSDLRPRGYSDEAISKILQHDYKTRTGYFIGSYEIEQDIFYPEGEDLYSFRYATDYPPGCDTCRLLSKIIAPYDFWARMGYPDKLKAPLRCKRKECRCKLEETGLVIKKDVVMNKLKQTS